MISGITVTVLRPGAPTLSRFGNEIPGEPTEETVPDVLIAPGSTSDLDASRPNGVEVAYTLHFPKDYAETLEGCSVALPAPYSGTYRVIGNPSAYMNANTPGKWNRPVEVEAAHG